MVKPFDEAAEQDIRDYLKYLAETGLVTFECFRHGDEGYEYFVRPYNEFVMALGGELKTDQSRLLNPLWFMRFSPSGRIRAVHSDVDMYSMVFGMLTVCSEIRGADPLLASFDGSIVSNADGA